MMPGLGFDTFYYEKLLGAGASFKRYAQSIQHIEGVRGGLIMVDFGPDIGIVSESFGTLASMSREVKE